MDRVTQPLLPESRFNRTSRRESCQGASYALRWKIRPECLLMLILTPSNKRSTDTRTSRAL